MLIIYAVIAYFLIVILSYFITMAVYKARVARKNKAFANLPKEVLLQHALMSPMYSSQYRNMIIFMDENDAMDIVIRRMLIDMGLIGYRKGGS